MRRTSSNEASPQLSAAIAKAVRGERQPLIDVLCRGSGLPGTRTNFHLAQVFAAECVTLGAAADGLIDFLAGLSADDAPGGGSGTYGAGSELEFLPVCGVIAAGARASRDETCRRHMLPVLHDAAGDLRFRVRDAVPLALAQLGGRMGDALVIEVEGWMDGFFHAAAVLRALVSHDWLVRVSDAPGACGLFVSAFNLASGAQRAAARYPGYKALLEAMQKAVEPMASRFGVPMFDALAGLAREKDPVLRDLITGAVDTDKLHARHADDVRRVLAAFVATKKPVRDPRSLPRPTRKRGGGQRRSG